MSCKVSLTTMNSTLQTKCIDSLMSVVTVFLFLKFYLLYK